MTEETSSFSMMRTVNLMMYLLCYECVVAVSRNPGDVMTAARSAARRGGEQDIKVFRKYTFEESTFKYDYNKKRIFFMLHEYVYSTFKYVNRLIRYVNGSKLIIRYVNGSISMLTF